MKEQNELSPELHELLSAERNADMIDRALQARLASRLETTLGVKLPGAEAHADHADRTPSHALKPAAVPSPARALRALGDPAAVTAVASSAQASALQWLLLKPVAAALVFSAGLGLGSVVTLGVQAGMAAREQARPQASTVTTRRPPATAEAGQPTAASAGTAAAPDSTVAAPSAKPLVAPAPTSTHNRPASARSRPAVNSLASTELAAEQRLVDQARSALARALPADALQALDAHRQRYPAGQLAEERASLYVVALARAGRIAEARQAAEAFRARYPTSLFTAIVERTLSTL